MSWQRVSGLPALQAWLAQEAVLVLWGGAHCGVCQVLQPRLAEMAAVDFPQLPLVAVDCQDSPAACAQHGVFALPVLRLYLHGQVALDYARAFGVAQVRQDMQRLFARRDEGGFRA